MTLLDSALDYASRGWRVLPVHGIIESDGALICTCKHGARCGQPGKHPAVYDWVEKATTDPEPIRRAWGAQANLNVGIATGERSGFFVLDIDPKDNGFESLEALQVEHGRLPLTRIAKTGSGGAHMFFHHIPGLGNRAKMRPGLDIRGDGGQVVAAPSRHWSGGVYEWKSEEPIVAAPGWLAELAKPSSTHDGRVVGRGGDEWADLWLTGVTEGGRNDAIAKMTGYLLRARLDPFMVDDMIMMWNRERISPPLSKEEVNTTMDSVTRKEIARVRKKREAGKK